MSGRVRRRILAATLLAVACSGDEAVTPVVGASDAAIPDASVSDGGLDVATIDGPVPAPLKSMPGAARYALVGEEVVLDGSLSTGATRYEWSFGDGRKWEGPREDAVARVTYGAPGRYQAVLTVYDASGSKHAAAAVVTVTHPPTFARSESATLVTMPDLARVAVISTDADEVVFVADKTGAFAELARVLVGDEPRTVTRFEGHLAVVCQGDDTIHFLPDASPSAKITLQLPYGARPFGAAIRDGELFVSLAGSGSLARIRKNGSAFEVAETIAGLPDARAVSAIPGGRIAVTRWRSPDSGGVVSVIDGLGPSETPSITTVPLAFDPQLASDTEIGGVPSYLQQLAVSPTGKELVVPSLQVNIADGIFRNGRAVTFETSIRAIVSFVDLTTMAEPFARRKQFDNRGLAGAATYSSRGDYLYVAMPGNRTIERLDVLTEVPSGNVGDVGFAPDGVALSSDDAILYVNVPLSRELVVYDTSVFDTLAPPLARVPLLSSAAAEPLAPAVLAGKRLFNDSADPRLAKDGYLACSHCHLEGDGDRRVWDFTGRGEGLRNTTSLLGRAGLGDGPLHWSANFDEVQDFEHDIRDAFEGAGLMTAAELQVGTRNQKLGDPKAGASTDLDALAAYVSSLTAAPRSPFRPAESQLSAAAARGQTIFASAGCPSCHSGARFTDSGWITPGVPKLHDVGTLGAGSGQRLGSALAGIDTPTLIGVFATPPYLHDGSAATLRDVLVIKNASNQHGVTTTLAAGDLDDLLAYLASL